MDVDAAMTYLDFVAERHRVWERRQAGERGPWSDDPVLRGHKFTNVFRVLDYGSQFLLSELLNEPGLSREDTLLRSILYRYTNRPDVWRYTRKAWGCYPSERNLGQLAELWCDWRDMLGGQVFSGAYVILPEPGVTGADKVRGAVALAERVLDEAGTEFVLATSVEERYRVLRAQRNVGDFMAMQITTDYGYSRYGAGTSEDDFVVAGPGARRGAAAIGMKPAAAIDWSWEVLRAQTVPTAIRLPDGNLRLPSKMDVQNTFCEFSKYVRFAARSPERKTYRPDHPTHRPAPVLPEHWT